MDPFSNSRSGSSMRSSDRLPDVNRKAEAQLPNSLSPGAVPRWQVRYGRARAHDGPATVRESGAAYMTAHALAGPAADKLALDSIYEVSRRKSRSPATPCSSGMWRGTSRERQAI